MTTLHQWLFINFFFYAFYQRFLSSLIDVFIPFVSVYLSVNAASFLHSFSLSLSLSLSLSQFIVTDSPKLPGVSHSAWLTFVFHLFISVLYLIQPVSLTCLTCASHSVAAHTCLTYLSCRCPLWLSRLSYTFPFLLSILPFLSLFVAFLSPFLHFLLPPHSLQTAIIVSSFILSALCSCPFHSLTAAHFTLSLVHSSLRVSHIPFFPCSFL